MGDLFFQSIVGFISFLSAIAVIVSCALKAIKKLSSDEFHELLDVIFIVNALILIGGFLTERAVFVSMLRGALWGTVITGLLVLNDKKFRTLLRQARERDRE